MSDKPIYRHTAAQEALADGPEYKPHDAFLNALDWFALGLFVGIVLGLVIYSVFLAGAAG